MASPAAPRLAIIGCGAIVEHHLFPALRRIGWLPGTLIDPSPQRRTLLAKRLGRSARAVAQAADWESVAGAFDAAIVAVPHSLHASIGTGLLRAGKHVFMEKPLATRTEACHAMVDAAEASGAVLSVGLLRRYLQVARWTKALLDSGTLGRIRHVDVREGFVFNWATSSDGLLRRETSGGGVLMDTGAHTLDLLAWWFGSLEATEYRDDAHGGVEADCVLTCRLPGGGTATVELSRTRALRNTARIEGENGFVEVSLSQNEVRNGSTNALAFRHEGASPAEMQPQLFPELFDAELTDFRSGVSGAARRGVSGPDAIASVALIEAAYAIRRPLDLPWVAMPGAAAAPGMSANVVASIAPTPRLPQGRTVVVTGATGFVGGRLVERLVLEQGARVRCLVRTLGQATRLARLPVEIVKVNLADRAAVDKAMVGADYVFHCAYDTRSESQNIEGTRNLIAAAGTQAVQRFVHVSTFSVYEPFPDGPLTEETRDGDRAWTYARTKLDLEAAVLGATRLGTLSGTVVQPSCVYGPFCKPWTDAPAEMLLSGKVVLPEPGDGICNAVHIDDLVDAMLLAATKRSAVGERFVISGPQPVTWGTFFEEFARALGTARPDYMPAAEIARRNSGFIRDLKMIAANPKKIIQIIVRWPPARHALQSGLEALPKPLYDIVTRRYFGNGQRPVGETFWPAPQLVSLYTSKAVVSTEKARRLLGYAPRRDFASGMADTSLYLGWAFGDVRQTVQRQQPAAAGIDTLTPADAAHAG